MKKNGILTRTINLVYLVLCFSCANPQEKELTDEEKRKIASEYYAEQSSGFIYPDSARLAQSARHLEISTKISEYIHYNLKYPAEGLEKKISYTILSSYGVAKDSTITIWCHRGKFNYIFEEETRRVLYEAVKFAFDTSMIETRSTYPMVFDYEKYMQRKNSK
jgi:hypothetical protein